MTVRKWYTCIKLFADDTSLFVIVDFDTVGPALSLTNELKIIKNGLQKKSLNLKFHQNVNQDRSLVKLD